MKNFLRNYRNPDYANMIANFGFHQDLKDMERRIRGCWQTTVDCSSEMSQTESLRENLTIDASEINEQCFLFFNITLFQK